MRIPLRSNTTTFGRLMAGARALWRANGMKEEQFGKPIIAVVNSFTQMVPGHTHLHDIGQHVKSIIESHGCFAAEFNTIAIDDGIAMGHDGMLYSLPSRDLIADSVEYMANAHKVDAMVCISNCDKITPGMLMAAMRLNIPAIFVSGGPMEAGSGHERKYDLIDAMVMAGDKSVSDAAPRRGRAPGLPDLRLLLRHVHRQLDELPQRGPRPGAAGQRHDRGHPQPEQEALRDRRGPHRRDGQQATTTKVTLRCCPARSPPRRRSSTP